MIAAGLARKPIESFRQGIDDQATLVGIHGTLPLPLRFVIDPCPFDKAQQASMSPQTTQRACHIRPGETVKYKQERIWDIDSNIVIIGSVYMLTILTSIAFVGGIL